MNQLIKDLADKAELSVYGVGFDGTSPIKNEEAINKFVELLLEEIDNVISGCDPSPKMILHQPYKRIIAAVDEHFLEEEN